MIFSSFEIDFEPTGSPVLTYSSTTAASIFSFLSSTILPPFIDLSTDLVSTLTLRVLTIIYHYCEVLSRVLYIFGFFT